MKILVLNGANLNMLGTREPKIYGTQTLEEINLLLQKTFPQVTFQFLQSNHEGVLIDTLQQTDADGVVLNAGGYTHTSVALRDAIASREGLRVAEVHLSNPSAREPFRHFSYLTEVCCKTFQGKKEQSYIEAVNFLLQLQNKRG